MVRIGGSLDDRSSRRTSSRFRTGGTSFRGRSRILDGPGFISQLCTPSLTLHTFFEQRPEGDVAMRFLKALLNGVAAQDGVAVRPEPEIEVE